MATCQQNNNNINNLASLVLNRSSVNHNHNQPLRFWSSFSGVTFCRKLIQSVACGGASISHYHDPITETDDDKRETKKSERSGSDKLSDFLNISDDDEMCVESEEEITLRKIEALEELKQVVKMLQCEQEEEKKMTSKRSDAAGKVRMLTKADSEARSTLAMLGAIPLLVAMIDRHHHQFHEDDNDETFLNSQISSLYALLNLGICNDLNKAAIVKAGAVHKMLKLTECPNRSVSLGISEAIVANFLSLSALDSNKLVIGTSGAIPFLVKTLMHLDSISHSQGKQDALRALYNLSIAHSNIPYVLETDLIPFLMNTLGEMEMSDRNLSILSNIVSTLEGRQAISRVPDAFSILVDVLKWTDSPLYQEKASYILMVMAHKSYGDRQTMTEVGVVSALLELTLLGSTLAQKRASRILSCLRVDKGKQVIENYNVSSDLTLSAPICGSSSTSTGLKYNPECLEQDEGMMCEERKAVTQLVQQSLQNNMKMIVKRANLPHDFAPSDHFKALTSSSTSKSLPF